MTEIFEICLEDLTPQAQQRYFKCIGGNDVNELIPIAIIEIEKEDDNQHITDGKI